MQATGVAVVDVNEVAAFEAKEAGTVDAVAFEEDGGSALVGVDVVGGGCMWRMRSRLGRRA